MQFYGNALLEYDNQDIRVLPSSAKPSDDRASVNMEIRDSKGTVYPVSYTMTNLAGGWKVRNVIINGINIGKLFRDQFADTMQKNRNDLEDHRRLGRGGRQGQGNRESGRGRGEMSQASLREGAAGELQLAGVLDYSSGPALREQGRSADSRQPGSGTGRRLLGGGALQQRGHFPVAGLHARRTQGRQGPERQGVAGRHAGDCQGQQPSGDPAFAGMTGRRNERPSVCASLPGVRRRRAFV